MLSFLSSIFKGVSPEREPRASPVGGGSSGNGARSGSRRGSGRRSTAESAFEAQIAAISSPEWKAREAARAAGAARAAALRADASTPSPVRRRLQFGASEPAGDDNGENNSATDATASSCAVAGTAVDAHAALAGAALADFDDLELLAAGNFGKVHLVRHRASGGFFAIKTLRKRHVVHTDQVLHVRNERDVLRACNRCVGTP